MKNMYEARILAIHKRWRIFPLVHRSRFAVEPPLLPEATSSIQQIEKWHRGYPGCTWALATGPQSNVFVLDASHDLGVQTLRAHCGAEFSFAKVLQIRLKDRIILFFRWLDAGFPSNRSGLIASQLYLRQAGSHVSLPNESAIWINGEGFLDDEVLVKDAPSSLTEYICAVLAKQEPLRVFPFPLTSTSTCSVLLIFTLNIDRWVCVFYAIGDGGTILKTLTFRRKEKVIALAKRSGAAMDAKDQASLGIGIEDGQGSIILNLTRHQYAKLLTA